MIIPMLAIGLLISALLMCFGLQPLLTLVTNSDMFQLLQAHMALDGATNGLIGPTFYVPAVVMLFCLGVGLLVAWFIFMMAATVAVLYRDYWTER